VRLLTALRLLEHDFVRTARKGRRPAPRAVELALESVARFKALFPERAESIAAALPWLEARRSDRGERAA
jgi:hypothetical protein